MPASPFLTWVILYNNYYEGIFPMANHLGNITWHFPVYRAVFSINDYAPTKSLRKVLKSKTFEFKINHAFEQVIRNCAEPRRKEEGTWLSEPMIEAYIDLHQRGHAHSIEVYQEKTLVGGLYGVQIGSVFFGESMFSRVSNASKVAFHFLMQVLKSNNFLLLDSQYLNDHTELLGAKEIHHEEFTALLKLARNAENSFKITKP